MSDDHMTQRMLAFAAQESADYYACKRCRKRPGTIRWGDALSLTHGGEVMWCSRCAARVQLRHAVGRTLAIPQLVWKALR